MNIYEKLLRIQQELKCNKNQRNNFGGYNYRNCEDILESVKPLLKETKTIVVLSDSMEAIKERYYIKVEAKIIDIETGENISNTAYAREEDTKKGMDGSQITGASSSYARKYALNGLFAIDDMKDSDTTNVDDSKIKTKNKIDVTNDIPQTCITCGKEVSDKVAKFSLRKYKKILCMECQKLQE